MTTSDVTATHLAWPALRAEDWTLYVSPRGLTTGSIPAGELLLDLELDFIDHQLRIRASDGGARSIRLEPKPVAEFHAQTLQALSELGVDAHIASTPNEVEPAIPFAEDYAHASYDPEAVQLFWRQLVPADRVIGEFRLRWRPTRLAGTTVVDFIGHSEPVVRRNLHHERPRDHR